MLLLLGSVVLLVIVLLRRSFMADLARTAKRALGLAGTQSINFDSTVDFACSRTPDSLQLTLTAHPFRYACDILTLFNTT
jgi:hypothetical protein